ncbi:MAG: hypothetical protein ACHQHM_06705, partial [Thermoanaerobaculales bacterium]
MNITEQHRLLSLGSVALGALVVGMVLASGLGLAPHAHAAKEPAVPVASAVPPGVSALPDFAALAERVTPSVVSVYTEEAGKSVDPRRFHQNLDPFEFFFGPGQGNPEGMRTPRRRGAGSGFFISNASSPGQGPQLESAKAGDVLTLQARVYNYSFTKMPTDA